MAVGTSGPMRKEGSITASYRGLNRIKYLHLGHITIDISS
jgi:hypothetical protein